MKGLDVRFDVAACIVAADDLCNGQGMNAKLETNGLPSHPSFVLSRADKSFTGFENELLPTEVGHSSKRFQ